MRGGYVNIRAREWVVILAPTPTTGRGVAGGGGVKVIHPWWFTEQIPPPHLPKSEKDWDVQGVNYVMKRSWRKLRGSNGFPVGNLNFHYKKSNFLITVLAYQRQLSTEILICHPKGRVQILHRCRDKNAQWRFCSVVCLRNNWEKRVWWLCFLA